MFQPFPTRRLTSRLLVPLFFVGACVFAAPGARAQQLREGFTDSVQSWSAATSLVLSTPAGIVQFDGTTVTLTPAAQPPQTLLQLPAFVYGSFLLQTDAGHVLFGCTGVQDTIWLLPLQGPPPAQPLATVAFNYDAAMFDATRVLLSARTGGFAAPDNELWLLDLATGGTQLVASVPGASGPVALSANGDVYYATGFAGFPMPPGTTRVLRFPRSRVDQAVAGNRVLGAAHAQVVIAGLDAASDMVFDDDGDLLVVDWFNSCIHEISDATGPQPVLFPRLLDYSTAAVSPTTLQFVAGSANCVFEPFQPANGSLLVQETDYANTSRSRTVQARPAALTTTVASPIASGPFQFATTDGASLGIGFLAFAFASTPGTIVLQVPGCEAPLAWSNALLASPVLVPLAFDAAGTATLPVVNPGYTPAVGATAQVAFLSASGALGATPPLLVLLGP